MRRGGVITQRRRERERGKRMRRRALVAGVVLLVCSLAMTPDLRLWIAEAAERGVMAAATFAGPTAGSAALTLPEITVSALQLGVYDSGERASAQQKRLSEAGVASIIWQREKMRIVCAVAMDRAAIDWSAAGGSEAFVITDTLPEVSLRLSCAAGEEDAAAQFVRLPDALLEELLSDAGRPVADLAQEVRRLSQSALAAHPEHLLYTQLAQSLINWCDLMESGVVTPSLRSYAAVTMCTICREWRVALLGGYESAASTASAQRTPSTAADVMPPA